MARTADIGTSCASLCAQATLTSSKSDQWLAAIYEAGVSRSLLLRSGSPSVYEPPIFAPTIFDPASASSSRTAFALMAMALRIYIESSRMRRCRRTSFIPEHVVQYQNPLSAAVRFCEEWCREAAGYGDFVSAAENVATWRNSIEHLRTDRGRDGWPHDHGMTRPITKPDAGEIVTHCTIGIYK